jgi:hydroxymethylglutaryl-CoA reductase
MSKKLRDYPVEDRADQLPLSADDRAALRAGLPLEQADHMIENVIATYALPFGVAQNFVINGRALPAIPMVVEEASIVAACSFSAKLAQPCGGFRAGASEPVMIGQIQTLDVPDMNAARASIAAESTALVEWLNTGNDSTRSRHARAIGIETRELPAERDIPAMLIVHVLYDCGDAMGANLVNTACEALAPKIESLTGGRVNLRILSNLSDRRMAWAECVMRGADLNTPEGASAAPLIQEASYFAERDPYRAATHNKGIMNGIDAVAVATGNDWRAIEAGAHAYAARGGRYGALATWRVDAQGDLTGRIELPLAVGIVGGATRVHPSAQAALRLLGITRASELAQIMACVGLAQNFGALRALATTGIQSGHMRLHARQIAAAAGATGADIERVAAQLIAEKRVRVERAREILEKSS